ncbi:MAG TPA: thiamine pyrophosphate-dependent dehydrogenase E1 component subunit alpha [Clostridiaceae bacterium]|nr:thiamine pyrophosphate-dependent dehydrogenase E1 component subunit alpha [Clostridiaceae bacterium]
MQYSIDNEKIIKMYEKMYLIRKYEERIYYLFLEGVMPGTIHQSHGQEACAVGMLYDLGKDDYMTSTHRPAGHCLAKGVPLESMMAEMFAKANGCCRGKGGAMHTGDMSVGAVPAIAIVGGGIPIAVGIGLSLKMRKTRNVVVCFFGDGASNEGAFHEGLNAAAIWNLPVIFACENNFYGASTHIKKVIKIENIADRAAAYGMPGEVVDGNDVLKVNEAAARAIERARRGEGPTLLELKTYRIGGHSRNDACGYRDKEEEKEWFAKDPIKRHREYILSNNILDENSLKKLEKEVEDRIERAVELAKASPDPKPEDALRHVYYEGGE